jgi:hypothetical protein
VAGDKELHGETGRRLSNGSVLVVDIVERHPSPWFRGPHALVLAHPRPEPFYRVHGQLALFPVQP